MRPEFSAFPLSPAFLNARRALRGLLLLLLP